MNAPERVVARILSRIEIVDGCWIFSTRNLSGDGYGRASWSEDGVPRSVVAHRAVYEYKRGPIADGLQLDHLCRTPRCVNPAHLEPVTAAENVRRYRSLATHCPQGHEYVNPVGTRRRCEECRKESGRRRQKRHYDKKRATT